MKKVILLFSSCVSVLAYGQPKGIKWIEGLSWQQVKEKAKTENKYIFIDCYATWCGPCKWMDKNVYIDQTIGDFFNGKFIALKLQMDSTKTDKDQARKWYEEAKRINQEYKISAYPTYLFFSPDGRIVHKAVGASELNDFLENAKSAIDVRTQYFSTLRDYQQGKRDTALMKQLAISTRSFGDMLLATQIANDYLAILGQKVFDDSANIVFIESFKKIENAEKIANEYINELTEEDLYSQKNLSLMIFFMTGSKDKIFDILYHNGTKADSIMGIRGYSGQVVRSVIKNEEISSYLNKAIKTVSKDNIDWTKINGIITEKYDSSIARHCVLESKVALYEFITRNYKKDWVKYIKYKTELIVRYGIVRGGMSDGFLNNFAFAIFNHCNDKKEIELAIKWMEGILTRNQEDENSMDTYANLLYKIGRIKDAKIWERKALKIAIDAKDDANQKTYEKTISKMNSGKPTWSRN